MTNLHEKIICWVVMLVCLVIGFAGIILPVIPGLLFLVFAAVAAARLSPAIERYLKKNQEIRVYLNQFSRVGRLGAGGKIKFSLLLCLRLFVESTAYTINLCRRGMALAMEKSGRLMR